MGSQLVGRIAEQFGRVHDLRRVRWDRVSADVLVLHRHDHQLERLHVPCRRS